MNDISTCEAMGLKRQVRCEGQSEAGEIISEIADGVMDGRIGMLIDR